MRRGKLWRRDAQICHLCREEVPYVEASRDHIIPVSVARDDRPENLALAHKACNNFRQAYPVDHFSVEEYRAARQRSLARAEAKAAAPSSAPQPKLSKNRWRCAFCCAFNDSAPIRGEWLPYRVCSNCKARRYPKFGFVLYPEGKPNGGY